MERWGIAVNIVLFILAAIVVFLLAVSLLTQNGQSLLGLRSYIVLTGSMSPGIEAGSYIFVKERPASDIETGDVISYITGDSVSILTHRVVEKRVTDGAVSFITQGDANNTQDEKPVQEALVQGVVFLTVPALGSILLALKTPLGIAFLAGIIIVLFAATRLYRRLTREPENEKTSA